MNKKETQRISAKDTPYYWVAKQGRDTWNAWQNGTLSPNQEQKLYDILPQGMRLPSRFDNIDFRKTNWSEFISFKGFVFNRWVDFSDACFHENAIFSDTVFCKGATFSNALFRQLAHFRNAEFAEKAYFKRTKFTTANFVNVTFSQSATFEECSFAAVPSFGGIKLQGAISFHNTSWPEVNPQLSEHNHEVACAWSILKAEMNRLQLHEEELFFFSKELETRASFEKNKTKKWLYSRYINICKCGASIALPFKGWLCVSVFMFFGYSATIFPLIQHAPEALYVTLSNSLPLLPASKMLDQIVLDNIKNDTLNILFYKALSIFHFAATSLYIFLIGLGIRNRLRIK